MSKIRTGTKVYWNDPADKLSGIYKIAKKVDVQNDTHASIVKEEFMIIPETVDRISLSVPMDELVFEEVVVFRKFLNTNEVIALFPNMEWSQDGSITSYMHVGQHSGAHYNHVIKGSKPVSAAECRPLLDELTNLVGYKNLKVVKHADLKSDEMSLIERIDELFAEYVADNQREPLHAMCSIKYLDDDSTLDCTIALTSGCDEDNTFYHCDSLADLKALTKEGCEDFVLVECEEFID